MTALPFVRSIFPTSSHDLILLVGGTVRDLLLKRKSKDIDLISALSHDELLSCGFYLVEAQSSAAIYFRHHPEFGKIEIVRIDNLNELPDELRRRDFTCNAMAMRLDGTLIDPLEGERDTLLKELRTCSRNSFISDPLRVFRAFRFESDGWIMTPESVMQLRHAVQAGTPGSIPVERFSGEMLKALSCRQPEIFFQRMIEYDAGGDFLPELFRMPNIPAGPLEHHPEGDLFSHSVEVLQRTATASDDTLIRFCAFFHDIGKLATDPALYPRHHGHNHAGFATAVALCDRLRLSTAHRTALAWISSLHGKANLWETLRDATKLTMAEQAHKAGIVEILPLVAAADKAGNPPMAGWHEAVRIAGLNTKELGVDQERLAAMPVQKRGAFILQKRVEALRGA